jgi:hypothetical protein
LVTATLSLAKLNRVIQAATGWTNSHLHEFDIAGRRYGMPYDEDPDEINVWSFCLAAQNACPPDHPAGSKLHEAAGHQR